MCNILVGELSSQYILSKLKFTFLLFYVLVNSRDNIFSVDPCYKKLAIWGSCKDVSNQSDV